MAKQYWSDDEIGRGAMIDTRKELPYVERVSGVIDSGRTKESRRKNHGERIRGNQRERNTLRENIRKIELNSDGRGRNRKSKENTSI